MRAALRPVGKFEDAAASERAEFALRQKIQADDQSPARGLFVMGQTVRTAYAARFGEFVRVDPFTGAFSIFLPDPDAANADCIAVTNVGDSYNDVTLRPQRADVTIGGLATYDVTGPGDTVWLYPDALSRNWVPFVPRPSALVRPVNNRYSPLANFGFFNRSLEDYSGNGYALTVEAGTERYSYTTPELGGTLLDGSTRYVVSAYDARLGTTGDLTVGYLGIVTALTTVPGANTVPVSHAVNGAGAANNDTFAMGIDDFNQLIAYSETGAAVGTTYTVNSGPTLAQPHLLMLRRTGGVWQWWLNGRTFGAASTVITAPTSGTNGRYRVGGYPLAAAGSNWRGTMTSQVFWDRALSDVELVDTWNYTCGRAYGFI